MPDSPGRKYWRIRIHTSKERPNEYQLYHRWYSNKLSIETIVGIVRRKADKSHDWSSIEVTRIIPC